jgi:hypothetical protein
MEQQRPPVLRIAELTQTGGIPGVSIDGVPVYNVVSLSVNAKDGPYVVLDLEVIPEHIAADLTGVRLLCAHCHGEQIEVVRPTRAKWDPGYVG